jgi:hypothetical protein
LQKPYNLSPTGGVAIDANEDNIFSWSVSGDVQIAFEIKIFNNTDNEIVWSLDKTNSYANSYLLPSFVLNNNMEFKWQVTIYNEAGKSIASDFVIFQTSSRPIITLSPIDVVSAPSYNFSAVYSQAEDIPLRSWNCILYNSEKSIIGQSGIKTQSTIEFLFSNLSSEKDYYIEFQVTSNKGLTNTTGKVMFSVLYTQPKVNVSLIAAPVPEVAGINLSWNVIQIILKSSCDPPPFLEEKGIDLTNGCRVWTDEGFSVDKTFTIKMWIDKPLSKVDLLTLQGDNGYFKLQYDAVDSRFYLYKYLNNNTIVSSWRSQPVLGDSFFVCLQQIDLDCNVYAESIIKEEGE